MIIAADMGPKPKTKAPGLAYRAFARPDLGSAPNPDPIGVSGTIPISGNAGRIGAGLFLAL